MACPSERSSSHAISFSQRTSCLSCCSRGYPHQAKFTTLAFAFLPAYLAHRIGLSIPLPARLGDRIGLLTAQGRVQAEGGQIRTHLLRNPVQALHKPCHFLSKTFSEACQFLDMVCPQTWG